MSVQGGKGTILTGDKFANYLSTSSKGYSHDLIRGYGGNDTLLGGEGNDELWGGDHRDTLYGGYGEDMLVGGNGSDVIYGDDASSGWNDTLSGWDGNDTLFGGGGDDLLMGHTDSDRLYGQYGNDSLYGGYDKDTLDGGYGNDSLKGGRHNDILRGGDGNDTLNGAGYNVTFKTENYPSKEYDSLTGGAGADVFELGNSFQAYYNEGAGFATITDFNYYQGDRVQLHGSSNDYSLQYGNYSGASDLDTLVKIDGDWIAVIEDNTSFSLSADANFV